MILKSTVTKCINATKCRRLYSALFIFQIKRSHYEAITTHYDIINGIKVPLVLSPLKQSLVLTG